MLINLTHHPHSKWEEVQKTVAEREYGTIVDIPFPTVEPEWSREDIAALADRYVEICREHLAGESRSAVHIMGEMTFTYSFVAKAAEKGVVCVASTTRRVATIDDQGRKISVFRFVKFRRY